MNITILGSGAFGLALAKALYKNNNKITIWSKFEEEINNLKNKYKEYYFTNNLEESLNNKKIIILAIPIEYINSTLLEVKKYYQKGIFLIASKGINTKTNQFAYEILETTIPNIPYGILSGGTFAKDMMEDKIMGITLATTNKAVKLLTKQALNSKNLKVEISNDIKGVSICGAIKNIIAIAFGILDGANYPESTKFMFLTEAILEIKRLLKKLGGKEKTILTYAGIDDIIMTSTSSKSRNYTLGQMIGKNLPHNKIEEYKNNNTIEGLGTTKAINNILTKKKINSKLINTIYRILYQNKETKELINYLENLKK